MELWLNEVQLTGNLATLLPLARSHRDALVAAAADGNLWELWFTGVPSESTIDQYLDKALSERNTGSALPFVVMDNETGRVIGSTRYCNVSTENRRLEIGYTWYAKSYQRTAVNSECKLLLLSHAFEALDAIAVEFRTHWHNHASRNAIARLGAKQDGILRNHSIEPDGAFRDTVVFSIINSEWPSVKKSLRYKLTRGNSD